MSEKAVFGGLAFLLDGNMSVGLSGDELMVRVGPEATDDALARPHARLRHDGPPHARLDPRRPRGVRSDDELAAWVERGVDFARSLPPKG